MINNPLWKVTVACLALSWFGLKKSIAQNSQVLSLQTLKLDSSTSIQLKEDPFRFNAIVQGGFFRNFSGGVQSGNDYIGRVHLILSLDTEKAGLWKNGQFLINGVNAHGGKPTVTYIGDFQPISRNEAAPERTGLFEFWYKHTIGKTSITLGQHDMNAILGTSEGGGNSINSAFGMNPSITPNAGHTFSIFPRTMPGVLLEVNSLKLGQHQLNLLAAVYAGFSQDFEDDPYNLKWNLDGNTHSRLEIQFIQIKNGQKRGKTKLGFLYHSGDFEDVNNTARVIKGNWGYYFITDQLLVPKHKGSKQGLGLFIQLGTAPGNQNLIDFFSTWGITYQGLFKNRTEDILFLGYLHSSMNNNLIQEGWDKSRSLIELNYQLKFGEHFIIQPDLQYIINPGANPFLSNALLGVLRFSINY